MAPWAVWLRAAIFLHAIVAAQNLPTTVELDIVFPQNDTYQRTSDFPIVFAVQNAATAVPYGFWIQWALTDLDHQNSTVLRKLDQDTWKNASLTGSGAYLLATNSPAIANSKATKWSLDWSMGFHQNCTAGHQIVSPSPLGTNGYEISGSMVFTTSAIGKTLDFLTTRPCPVLGGAIGIKSNLTTTRGEACPVLEEKEPQGNPCAFIIDATIANNISTQLDASSSCAGTTGTCRTSSSAGTPSKRASGFGLMVVGMFLV